MQDGFVAEVTHGIEIFGYGGAVLLFMVLVAETFIRWREGLAPWSKEGLNSALFFVTVGPVAEGLFLNAALIGALSFFYQLTPLRVPVAWWTLPIYLLAGEFAFYWFHRVSHRVRLFWADHSIHHSATVFDFTVNLRFVPFQIFYRLLLWTPLVLLGFHPVILVLFAITVPSWQTFCHTTRIGRFPSWFEWLFVTPCNHGVHHACNPLYIDKNYGGLLMIWDHAFGSYQRLEDDVPPIFGITRTLHTSNPFKVLAHEFLPLFRDVRAAPTWRTKLWTLFGPPEAAKIDDPQSAMAAPATVVAAQ
jgi:sterol desaturase/sphingolipid hydroxylase (fatty acid hydroxylase superfamily)